MVQEGSSAPVRWLRCLTPPCLGVKELLGVVLAPLQRRALVILAPPIESDA
jgi:hypothetical protein